MILFLNYKQSKMLFIVIVKLLLFHAALANIHLEHISTVYVPHSYSPEVFLYNAEVGEQLAVNDDYPYIYTIGNNMIHVINFTEMELPEIIYYTEVMAENEGALCDITTCQDWVAINIDNKTSPLDGKTMVYTRYNANNDPPMELIADVIVGAVPDSALFTSDCSKLIVAIEAEVRNVNGVVVDPEGGVTVIDFGGPPGHIQPDVTFFGFQKFNDMEAYYTSIGVRKVYNGQGTEDIASTTLSQDLEPENVAISYDDRFAYVPLQENNAIAVFDIDANDWVDIYPMGFKDYNAGNAMEDKLDASDRDNATNIRHWPIMGMYQADGIKFLSFEGKEYVITANEGDTKEYTSADLGLDEDWTEALRGIGFIEEDILGNNVTQEMIESLSDESELGRLYMSTIDGLDSNGKVETLYTFGGRCIAIHRVADFSLAYDSASSIQEQIANNYPIVFNGNTRNADISPAASYDDRSDDRGSEPEAVEYGLVGNQTVVFVGIERPGMVAIYTITKESDALGDGLQLEYQSMYYAGGTDDTKTWQELYEDRETYMLEAEDLRFIPDTKTNRGNPLLVVTGAVSGTISFFDVIDDSISNSAIGISGHMSTVWMILALLYYKDLSNL